MLKICQNIPFGSAKFVAQTHVIDLIQETSSLWLVSLVVTLSNPFGQIFEDLLLLG